MQIRPERLIAGSLAALAVAPKAAATCAWDYDCFTSPAGNLYSVGECGYSHKLGDMRDRFVKHCNATSVGGFHETQYWHSVAHWYPIYVTRKQDDVNDTVFEDCLKQHHASLANPGAAVSATAVMLGAFACAYLLA